MPKGEGPALVSAFFFPWLAVTLLWFALAKDPSVFDRMALLALLHLSLSTAYVFTYPALEGLSPSLIILTLIEKEASGMTEDQIACHFDVETLWGKKIEGLVGSGLVKETADRLRITGRGRIFIFPYIALRRFLGLPMGGG